MYYSEKKIICLHSSTEALSSGNRANSGHIRHRTGVFAVLG